MKFLLGRVNELSIIHITGKSMSDKIRQPQVEEVLNLFSCKPSRKYHNSLVEKNVKNNYGTLNFVGEHVT